MIEPTTSDLLVALKHAPALPARKRLLKRVSDAVCMLLLLAWFVLKPASVLAKDPPLFERIRFKKGEHSAVISGFMAGQDVKSYIFSAKSDQWLVLHLSSTRKAARFRLYEFGDSQSGEVELGNGTDWEGVLADSAEYAIYVYSEGKSAKYTLQLSIK
jgi:hypothetical protein